MTVKKGCQAYIYVSENEEGNDLVVMGIDLTHNHELQKV